VKLWRRKVNAQGLETLELAWRRGWCGGANGVAARTARRRGGVLAGKGDGDSERGGEAAERRTD